jgi:hypothetical protein
VYAVHVRPLANLFGSAAGGAVRTGAKRCEAVEAALAGLFGCPSCVRVRALKLDEAHRIFHSDGRGDREEQRRSDHPSLLGESGVGGREVERDRQ